VTAIVYREYTLLCDALSDDEPGRKCDKPYGPFGVERTPGELRKLAAAEGWTYKARGGDFCPRHSGEETRPR